MNWDDELYVTSNEALLSEDAFYWIWIKNEMPNPYPITFSVLRLEYLSFGLNPVPFHYCNVLLHLLNIILFALFLNKVKVPFWILSFSVAMYALHPVQVETVMWISEVKNLLSTAFYWMSWLAFLHYLEIPEQRKRFYALGLSLFIFSLASKSMTVTLPVSLTVWLWFFHRANFKSFALRFIPLWFISIAFGLLSIYNEHKLSRNNLQILLDRTLLQKITDVSEALYFYLFKFFYPLQLYCVYPKNPLFGNHLGIRTGATFLLLLLLLLLIKNSFFSQRNDSKLAFFCLWNFCIVAGPVLGWFPTSYMLFSHVADRYNYHPLPFLIVFLGLGIFRIMEKFSPRMKLFCLVFGGVLFSFLSVLTFHHARVWTNSIRLWSHCVHFNDSQEVCFYNLGEAYSKRGDLEGAEKAFRQSLEINPSFSLCLYAYGLLLCKQEKFSLAEVYLSRVLRAPDLPLHPSVQPLTHFMLANTAEKRNDTERAIHHYQEVLRLLPLTHTIYRRSRLELGLLLCQQARFAEARPYLLQAEQENFWLERTYVGLGVCFASIDPEKAEAYFWKALTLHPNEPYSSKSLDSIILGIQQTGEYPLGLKLFSQWLQHRTGINDPERKKIESRYYLLRSGITNPP